MPRSCRPRPRWRGRIGSRRWKRAIDRGERYAEELARAKKLGGFTLNFTALERYMNEGAAAPQELAKSFRKVANAMLDAEAEPADATLMDRLLSGARSIVRVRKAGHAADDASLEAIIGRMEAAVKEAVPDITILFVKPQSREIWQGRFERLAKNEETGHGIAPV